MGNKPSLSPRRSPSPPLPSSSSPAPPSQLQQQQQQLPMRREPTKAAALMIESPNSATTMLPAISITLSVDTNRSHSPPPPSGAGGAWSPSSLRATPGGMFKKGGSPVPAVSPRSAASRASTVTSFDAEQEQQSYFWARLKGQYQERKTLRRQSMLGTASKLGRPCHLAIQSITLQGAIPPGAQVHVEVSLSPGTAAHEQNLLLFSSTPLPPLATPPRAPVPAGEMDTQRRVDHVVLPSVTATSALLLTVRLEGHPHPLAALRYPLADVTVTLRPTELRLTPAAHGEGATRSRSPSGMMMTMRSPFGPRRSESPKPLPAVLELSPSPQPMGDAAAASPSSEARPPLPTLGAVWGELSFFDNRTSGVGWVGVVEELGKPVNQRRLLLVTPPTFALLADPACTLGFAGYPLIHVSHVEPGRRLLPTTGGDIGGGTGFVTITLCRAEVKAAPGSGHDIVLMADGGEEEARRWTQILKRAAHEASYGGEDG